MPDVKCSVSSCEYWATNNNCHADAIMIDIDEHLKADYEVEFAGEQLANEHQDRVSQSSGTRCHTFKLKH